jgi:hypothetical protein
MALVSDLMVVVPKDLGVIPIDVAHETLTVVVGGKSDASQRDKVGMRDCVALGCWEPPFLVIEDKSGHQDRRSEGEKE